MQLRENCVAMSRSKRRLHQRLRVELDLQPATRAARSLHAVYCRGTPIQCLWVSVVSPSPSTLPYDSASVLTEAMAEAATVSRAQGIRVIANM